MKQRVRKADLEHGSLDNEETPAVQPLRPRLRAVEPLTGPMTAQQAGQYLNISPRLLAQPSLRSVNRIIEILEQVFETRVRVLTWLNSPHPDLGLRTPLEVIRQGYPKTIEDMLEAALLGIPA